MSEDDLYRLPRVVALTGVPKESIKYYYYNHALSPLLIYSETCSPVRKLWYRYTDKDVERIKLIHTLLKAEYTVQDIAHLSNEEMQELLDQEKK